MGSVGKFEQHEIAPSSVWAMFVDIVTSTQKVKANIIIVVNTCMRMSLSLLLLFLISFSVAHA